MNPFSDPHDPSPTKVDLGREREAVAVSLTALYFYLPRYNRSLRRYAKDLA